jgi:hypothetical protein
MSLPSMHRKEAMAEGWFLNQYVDDKAKLE